MTQWRATTFGAASTRMGCAPEVLKASTHTVKNNVSCFRILPLLLPEKELGGTSRKMQATQPLPRFGGSERKTIELGEQVRHFNRSEGSFSTLVAELGTSTFDRLLNGFGCKYTENSGYACL